MNIPLREAFSALGGATIVAIAVVWSGGLPGWMFLAGFLVALACVLTLVVAIGAGRLARMLAAFAAALAGVQSTVQATPAAPADPVQADVVAALVSLGAKPAKARAAAERTADGPRDLKSWLNRAVRAA
jgi:hypothetical protein